MGLWSLFLVASMPTMQVLLIGLIGAFLASGHSNILSVSAQKDMNKVVFTVFTPSLIFASLAKTVTLKDIISWWFMPVGIGLTFLFGGILGWLAVKVLRPPPHLRGLVIAFSSTGNLGFSLLIIVPAICDEEGNPFSRVPSICRSRGLSYASFSMALGGFYIWTYTYSLMKKAGKLYHETLSRGKMISEIGEKDDGDENRAKVEDDVAFSDQEALVPPSYKSMEEREDNHIVLPLLSNSSLDSSKRSFCGNLKNAFRKIIEELLAPPSISAIIGFVVGATPCLKSLVIGEDAPLRVVQDSLGLLGDATIPCITLILGGNLTQGLRKSAIKPVTVIAIICIRYVILPVIGIGIVRAAYEAGFLPHEPLFRYVLMIQFSLPPAMNIGTMAQLFDVGQEECSFIFLWTYLVAAISLTVWSTVFMWILS